MTTGTLHLPPPGKIWTKHCSNFTIHHSLHCTQIWQYNLSTNSYPWDKFN